MTLKDLLSHYFVHLEGLVEVAVFVLRETRESLVVVSLAAEVLLKLVVFEVLEAVAVYNLEVPGLVAYH